MLDRGLDAYTTVFLFLRDLASSFLAENVLNENSHTKRNDNSNIKSTDLLDEFYKGIRLILSKNPDLSKKNAKGITALEFAKEKITELKALCASEKLQIKNLANTIKFLEEKSTQIITLDEACSEANSVIKNVIEECRYNKEELIQSLMQGADKNYLTEMLDVAKCRLFEIQNQNDFSEFSYINLTKVADLIEAHMQQEASTSLRGGIFLEQPSEKSIYFESTYSEICSSCMKPLLI